MPWLQIILVLFLVGIVLAIRFLPWWALVIMVAIPMLGWRYREGLPIPHLEFAPCCVPVSNTAKQSTWTSKNGMDETQLTRSSGARVSGGSVTGITVRVLADGTPRPGRAANNAVTSTSARLRRWTSNSPRCAST